MSFFPYITLVLISIWDIGPLIEIILQKAACIEGSLLGSQVKCEPSSLHQHSCKTEGAALLHRDFSWATRRLMLWNNLDATL